MKAFNMLAGLLALAAAAPAAAAEAPGKATESRTWTAREVRLTRTFMLGAWTDSEDCGEAVEFLDDGRFFSGDGVSGIWFLEGDELTLTSDNILTIRIVPIDRDTIGVISPDGSVGQSMRCEPEALLPGPDDTV